jgi:L-iditol 2-dehydrogenase
MKAALWNESGRLRLADEPAPQASDSAVLVRPTVVGICGSDLHFFRGEFKPQTGTSPGHEIAGYIESGEGFAAGTPVAIEPTITCGRCPSCRRGQPPTCRRLGLMGISSPGGMQELLSAPPANVHPLAPGVGPDIGALAEPLAVCVRGLNRAEAPVGSRVLVLGSGTIGLLSVLLARELALEVAATARYPHQAELARAMGATTVFAPGSQELQDWARRNPVDLVIETVGGSADTLAEAVNAVRGGGTVLPLGIFTTDVMIPARKLVNQEVRVIGSVVYGHAGHLSEFGAAVGLLGRYDKQLQLLKSASYPLERANDAFEHALDKSRKAVKVSVVVQS